MVACEYVRVLYKQASNIHSKLSCWSIQMSFFFSVHIPSPRLLPRRISTLMLLIIAAQRAAIVTAAVAAVAGETSWKAGRPRAIKLPLSRAAEPRFGQKQISQHEPYEYGITTEHSLYVSDFILSFMYIHSGGIDGITTLF